VEPRALPGTKVSEKKSRCLRKRRDTDKESHWAKSRLQKKGSISASHIKMAIESQEKKKMT